MATIWIDTDECMGAGTCEQVAPEVFAARTDGTWVVKEDARYFGQPTVFDGVQAPEGSASRARLPEQLVDLAFDATEECPGECIYVEVHLESASPKPGWTAEAEGSGPDHFTVVFKGDDREIHCKVEFENGEVEIDIED